MQHIQKVIPGAWRAKTNEYDVNFFRNAIPELDDWKLSDGAVQRAKAQLLEFLRQQTVCNQCPGFDLCPKEGDMQGFTQTLNVYGGDIALDVARCKPFVEHQVRKRVEKWSNIAGGISFDASFTFENFPAEQGRKYPRLMEFAKSFADSFVQGIPSDGLYLFGPPGVGKTHLLLAVLNTLQHRGVPCLFVRSDSIFDQMRHIIADNGDLEPFLDACATVPVLGIDEFAQERANEFTLEKLFRIINHRFHAKLPTWFTSNFAPPSIYRKNGSDILDSVGPLRSRIMQMAKLAKMDGEDARQRNLESLT